MTGSDLALLDLSRVGFRFSCGFVAGSEVAGLVQRLGAPGPQQDVEEWLAWARRLEHRSRPR